MSNLVKRLGFQGVDAHDNPQAVCAWCWLDWLLFALTPLAIPAFYIELVTASPGGLAVGRGLYVSRFLGFVVSLGWIVRLSRSPKKFLLRNRFDLFVLFGAASIAWGATPWSSLEWVLRMAFMCLVAIRILSSLRSVLASTRLLVLFITGIAVLALGGAGFYRLEPRVHTYAEGVWFAFESSATVGYGDIAPTTPASRVFARFVVLLGYGMFSLVFASIAATFIGQEERLLRREMYRDIKRLHEQIAALHQNLQGLRESVERASRAASENGCGTGE
ncbi:potassium channel family protein [Paraburkholderia phenazinium]|uniref:Voltage-gated potassium channel n=1 Tax=Paraburkholderia phenazinium TaxID=60549 RepID=A0A1G8BDC5_9BURK|nr:potassium channel family protein [Paraburkholderia phenazinium]SDH31023.1 voltage-gated potassium channel [Paraburkholderia phenazinium]